MMLENDLKKQRRATSEAIGMIKDLKDKLEDFKENKDSNIYNLNSLWSNTEKYLNSISSSKPHLSTNHWNTLTNSSSSKEILELKYKNSKLEKENK